MQENTQENLSINKRIFQLIEYLNITRYKFAQETGISEAVLLNIIKEKNKPGYDQIVKILNRYKVISADWLLTGTGAMLKGGEESGSPPGDVQPPGCELCKEKDKVIAAQQAQIATQSEYIEVLKAQSPCESGQKRKAC